MERKDECTPVVDERKYDPDVQLKSSLKRLRLI